MTNNIESIDKQVVSPSKSDTGGIKVVIGAKTSSTQPTTKFKDKFNVRRTPNFYVIENKPIFNNAERKRNSTKQIICPVCLKTFDQSHFSTNQWTKIKPVCKQCITKN